ncbi:MAG: hypothetical protein ACRC7I_12410 [Selenomonadaceae bacterium]
MLSKAIAEVIASHIVLVTEIDNREFMERLFAAMYEELPAPKKKNRTDT